MSTGAAMIAFSCLSPAYRWLIVLILSVVLIQPVTSEPAAQDADPAENSEEAEKSVEDESPQPSFDGDEAKQQFEKGLKLFEERQWRDASRSFGLARKGTADKDSRSMVSSWEKACKGGKALDRAVEDLARKKYRKAWIAALALHGKYGATPLVSPIEKLKEEVYPQLFLDLACFEAEPVEVEAAARKALPADRSRLTKDPDRITEGKGALEWRSGGGQGFAGLSFGRLPLASIGELVMDDYRWIRFSIFNEDDNFGKFTLFFGKDEIGPNRAWAGAGGIAGLLRRDCYYHHFTLKKPGWNHFRIDLTRELSMNASVTWSDLLSLYLMTVPPSHPKKITIDAVKLERP